MPKIPNPKAKTLRLVLIPKENQEMKIRAFKEICARNGFKISDVLFERVESFLREHNWPPGNSQTLLSSFGAERSLTCFRCKKKFRSLIRVEYISGLEAQTCRDCLETDKRRRVVKKVKGGA